MRTSAPHLSALVALALALGGTACWDTNGRMAMADEPEERLAQDTLRYPDDAVDNDNGYVGPFCCTGRTLTFESEDGYPVGYVYLFSWQGQAFNVGDGSAFPNLQLRVAASTDLSDPDAAMESGDLMVTAASDTLERVYEVALGRLVFAVRVVDAEVAPVEGEPKGFRLGDGSPLTVDVEARVVPPGQVAELEEPLSFGTHRVDEDATLRFAGLELAARREGSSLELSLAEGDWSLPLRVGEIGFRELLALSGTSERRSGVIAGLQSGDGDGLLLFVNHYWPGQETFRPGVTTNVNLTVGDQMDLPDGSFVLDSVANDGDIAGTFTPHDGGEPMSIQLTAGEPFAVPGLDTTGFTPLETFEDGIHFEVSAADP